MSTPADVTFRTAYYTTLCGSRLVGTATYEEGKPVAFTLDPLTACCEAAVTGAGDGSGVVCKSCYLPADEPARVGNFHGVELAARAAGCPSPVECADHSWFTVGRELGFI